jgi:uroporphyrinogen-III synthase
VDAEALRRACALLERGQYYWTVFTSANAVEVFLDALWEAGADARLLAGTRLCAVGPATAAALAARGLRADRVPADAVGEAVLEALAGRPGDAALDGTRLLLPRAEGARDVLPEGLRAAGATVDELTLYLAAPPAEAPSAALDAVRAGAVDAVTFTSSSTVRNLATLLGGDLSPLRGALVACIGPVVAETAREHGLAPHVVAEEHTVEGMVAALRAYVHSTAQHSAPEGGRSWS